MTVCRCEWHVDWEERKRFLLLTHIRSLHRPSFNEHVHSKFSVFYFCFILFFFRISLVFDEVVRNRFDLKSLFSSKKKFSQEVFTWLEIGKWSQNCQIKQQHRLYPFKYLKKIRAVCLFYVLLIFLPTTFESDISKRFWGKELKKMFPNNYSSLSIFFFFSFKYSKYIVHILV